MLSIIISSYQKSYYDQFEKNIEASIGTDFQYEIIKIENPGIMGICSAYNLGASKAKFPYFLFVHEDVQFETQNWGDKLVQHLKRPEVGIVGLAGANRKTKMMSSWYQLSTGNNDANRFYYRQIFKFQEREPELRVNNPFYEDISPVITLDGLFLAIESSKFNQFKFDENLLKSFHGYDLDFSLSVSTRYQNIVIYDILLTHFSEGKVNELWENEVLLVHKKWMNLLPLVNAILKDEELDVIENQVFYETLNRVFSYGISKVAKLIIVWRLLTTYKIQSKIFDRSFIIELKHKLLN
tara:strand:+ start:2601 stop:3488 length:888 start_codon:yes stop_codon:yes gene_type:complete